MLLISKPGYVRARCPDCSKVTKTNSISAIDSQASFCAVGMKNPHQTPNVRIEIAGIQGEALLDTGAVTSITSSSLHSYYCSK